MYYTNRKREIKTSHFLAVSTGFGSKEPDTFGDQDFEF